MDANAWTDRDIELAFTDGVNEGKADERARIRRELLEVNELQVAGPEIFLWAPSGRRIGGEDQLEVIRFGELIDRICPGE
jgi:hypothetical protein